MKYGLIGEHLSHSYSCEIHSVIADYTYELCELRPDELDLFFARREFNAINVTIPYKQAVIKYLDGISEKAKQIGAVNTVVNCGGKLYGYNTDYMGMLALARKIGVSAEGRKILILGTGGTSKTANAVAKALKAGEVLTVSRTPRPGCVTYEDAVERHSDAQIIFNTTPVGMYPNENAQAISLDGFSDLKAVLDVVYNPLRTDLVSDAHSRNIPAEGGLYMLSAQAVAASALFLNKPMNDSDIDKAFSYVRNKKRNVVLIGMPSCGKSSVGRELALKMGLEFADTDELIIKKIGMPIADYFAENGEQKFRDAESTVIADISKTGGKVIATGGGAVLRDENIRALKRNGVLVFIDRAIENLTATSDRPLSSDKDKLLRLYNERFDRYCRCADVHTDGNGGIEAVADMIFESVTK